MEKDLPIILTQTAQEAGLTQSKLIPLGWVRAQMIVPKKDETKDDDCEGAYQACIQELHRKLPQASIIFKARIEYKVVIIKGEEAEQEYCLIEGDAFRAPSSEERKSTVSLIRE